MSGEDAIESFVRTHVVRARRSHAGDGLAWFATGAPADELNGVLRAEASRLPEAEAAVVGVPALWHSWPGHERYDIERELLARGFAFVEEEPLMTRELPAPVEVAVEPAAVAGVRIRPATTTADLRAWATVWLGSDPDPAVVAALAEAPTATYLLAETSGRAVGCAAAVTAGDAVAVEHVVTDADHRGRGIGTALTAAVLAAGVAAGASTALLTASPDGAGIYRRLGFASRRPVRRFTRP
ncbi:GNAT family N-acetyltransferase [Leifsonia sp. NPDC080035]|uniref:GNAT family N-acetyltransferase n=1 Tax=Leifsonia sp. NPDC080035 TaxID=3143936 RepID=A0AAU7GDE9_9MICO